MNVLCLSLWRHGSDVARVRVPFGDIAGIDAIAKIASRKQGAAATIKGYSHFGSFDFAGVGTYQGSQDAAQDQFITSITFKGDLVAGVYGELVEHFRQGGGIGRLSECWERTTRFRTCGTLPRNTCTTNAQTRAEQAHLPHSLLSRRRFR